MQTFWSLVHCPDQFSQSCMLIKPFLALFWVSGSAHSAYVHRGVSAATSDCQPAETLGWAAEGARLSWAMATAVCRAAHGAGVGAHPVSVHWEGALSLPAGRNWGMDLWQPHLSQPAEPAWHFPLAERKKRVLKISAHHIFKTKFSFLVPHTVIVILHSIFPFYSSFHSGHFTHLHQSSLLINIFSLPFHFYPIPSQILAVGFPLACLDLSPFPKTLPLSSPPHFFYSSSLNSSTTLSVGIKSDPCTFCHFSSAFFLLAKLLLCYIAFHSLSKQNTCIWSPLFHS